MQFAQLGRTGLSVSRICLGTMNFGWQTDEADSFEIMDHALDQGINFFDSANVYGAKRGEGLTESIVGKWFAQGSGRRERVVIATKVYGRMGDGPNEARLSALNIRRACEESLGRLQTDHIDLYQMHHIDRKTPWEEIWQAMEQLVQEGKVIYVGSSNFAAWHITRANAKAEARGFLGLVSEQSLYNLSARTVELEVLPACEALGVGILPWSPLGGGFLAGAGDASRVRRQSDLTQRQLQRHGDKMKRYEDFCAGLGERPADVAVAWLLAQPAVTSPIVGPRTLEQSEGSLRAVEIQLSDDDLATLDKIWPGPGGAAPEAYAW